MHTCVQHQLWLQLLQLRIKMQPLLTSAARWPSTREYASDEMELHMNMQNPSLHASPSGAANKWWLDCPWFRPPAMCLLFSAVSDVEETDRPHVCHDASIASCAFRW